MKKRNIVYIVLAVVFVTLLTIFCYRNYMAYKIDVDTQDVKFSQKLTFDYKGDADLIFKLTNDLNEDVRFSIYAEVDQAKVNTGFVDKIYFKQNYFTQTFFSGKKLLDMNKNLVKVYESDWVKGHSEIDVAKNQFFGSYASQDTINYRVCMEIKVNDKEIGNLLRRFTYKINDGFAMYNYIVTK